MHLRKNKEKLLSKLGLNKYKEKTQTSSIRVSRHTDTSSHDRISQDVGERKKKGNVHLDI